MKWPWQKKEKWTLYQINEDGQFVGTKLITEDIKIEKSLLPDVVWMELPYSNRPLPKGPDWDDINAVADHLDELEEANEIKIVMTMVRDGVRTWMLYAKNGPAFEQHIKAALPQYQLTTKSDTDTTWYYYTSELQSIESEKT